MAESEVRAARARLEEAAPALARIPVAERIDALCEALDRLRDDPSWTERLARELGPPSGLAVQTIQRGAAWAFDAWGAEGLRALIASEWPSALDSNAPVPQLRRTAIVPAGCIPMPSIESLLAALLLGSTAIVRPGTRDPVSAHVFRDLVGTVDARLADAVAIVSFDREDAEALTAFSDADALIVSGSNETVDALRQNASAGTRFVGYGHRLSVAVLGVAAKKTDARALARDVCVWDQLGCLSPVVAYALGDADAWADALAEAFEAEATALPRGDLPIAAAAQIRHEREAARMRSGTRVIAGDTWSLVREADAAWRPSPLHRFLRVCPVAGAGELRTRLAEIAPRISTIGLSSGIETGPAAFDWPAPRTAALGRMQTPPLDWNHDGIGTLRPLLP